MASVNIWSFPGCPPTPLWGGKKGQTVVTGAEVLVEGMLDPALALPEL